MHVYNQTNIRYYRKSNNNKIKAKLEYSQKNLKQKMYRASKLYKDILGKFTKDC